MNQLQTETRRRFRWLRITECDAGVTIRTARAELPTGLVVERVDGAAAPLVFVPLNARPVVGCMPRPGPFRFGRLPAGRRSSRPPLGSRWPAGPTRAG